MTTRALSQTAASIDISLSPPLRLWAALSRSRKRLSALDDRELADIGLTPELAKTEASRPFWDVPAHWRC
jgi:uncharacterized protein YjiS (DUF1127 family)